MKTKQIKNLQPTITRIILRNKGIRSYQMCKLNTQFKLKIYHFSILDWLLQNYSQVYASHITHVVCVLISFKCVRANSLMSTFNNRFAKTFMVILFIHRIWDRRQLRRRSRFIVVYQTCAQGILLAYLSISAILNGCLFCCPWFYEYTEMCISLLFKVYNSTCEDAAV